MRTGAPRGSRTSTVLTMVGVVVLVAAGAAIAARLATSSATRTGSAPHRPWRTVLHGTFSQRGRPWFDSNWVYDTGTGYRGAGCPAHWGTGEVETATRSRANVRLEGNGTLRITPLRMKGQWTSGRIETRSSDFAAPPGGQLQVSAIIKQPGPRHGLGYWPAFWMLGSGFRVSGAGTAGLMNCNDSPSGGEVDILEDVNARSMVAGSLHCGTAPGGPCNEYGGQTSGLIPCPGCQSRYATYSVIIGRASPGNERITWYLNGRAYHTVSEQQVGTRPWQAAVDHGFFLILDVAMGGGFPDGECGCTTPTAQTNPGAAMLVKSVTVQVRPAP